MTDPNGSFCKSQYCPTSDDLLAFQETGTSLHTAGWICDHMRRCEFCSAEVEFYRHYPPVTETVAAGRIPEPLLELAEALLRKERDLSPLYRLIGD